MGDGKRREPDDAASLDDLDVLVIDAGSAEPTVPGLTESEQAVARLAIDGRSNAEIAEARGVTAKTVANQLRAIYQKLGIASRYELAALLLG